MPFCNINETEEEEEEEEKTVQHFSTMSVFFLLLLLLREVEKYTQCTYPSNSCPTSRVFEIYDDDECTHKSSRSTQPKTRRISQVNKSPFCYRKLNSLSLVVQLQIHRS